jgi:hypothetical protein
MCDTAGAAPRQGTGPAASAGFLAGSTFPARLLPEARADEHPAKADTTDVKAPVAEVLHCPLAFAGVHLLKEMPEVSQVAYHYCKPLGDDLAQCLLYDGTGPEARLIGTEYLVSPEVYGRMPPEEKAY